MANVLSNRKVEVFVILRGWKHLKKWTGCMENRGFPGKNSFQNWPIETD